ncbi:MAG: hypothetical protein Q9M92_17885 [Enterobacterales bacterium]|nr:hypothetical protein [Enterobacterales bacterium]
MKFSKAIILSILAHMAILALLVFNYRFSKIEVVQSTQGKHINAVAMSSSQIKKQRDQRQLKLRKRNRKSWNDYEK